MVAAQQQQLASSAVLAFIFSTIVQKHAFIVLGDGIRTAEHEETKCKNTCATS